MMKKIIKSILILSLILSGCVSKTTTSSIDKIIIDPDESSTISMLYPYFQGFSINNISKGKIIIEAYQQDKDSQIVKEYDLSTEKMDELYLGLSTFTLENPSLSSFFLHTITVKDGQEKYEDYEFISNYEGDTITKNHREQSYNQKDDFKLLGIVYGYDSSCSKAESIEINNQSDLISFYKECIYAFSIYYVGESL